MAAVTKSDFVRFPFYTSFQIPCSLGITPLRDANAHWSRSRRSDYFYPEMIPEPDYSESSEDEKDVERVRDIDELREDEEDVRKRRAFLPPSRLTKNERSRFSPNPHVRKSISMEDTLIRPKKPANPYVDSEELQRLNKELKFNQKYGKNVINQRTELHEALRKYTDNKTKKSLAASRRSSLEKILEKQAKKIEMLEKKESEENAPSWIEGLQRQHNCKKRDPKTDEFYRVHAKVVNNFRSFAVREKESSPKKTQSQTESESDSDD